MPPSLQTPEITEAPTTSHLRTYVFIFIVIVILAIAGAAYAAFYYGHPSDAQTVTTASTTPTMPTSLETVATPVQPISSDPSMQQTTASSADKDSRMSELKNVIAQLIVYAQKDELTPEEQSKSDALQSQYEALNSQLQALNTDGVSGGIQADAYGYAVSVTINGKDAGFTGGKYKGIRLFNPEHYSYALATPEVQATQYLLKKGANTFVITYKKTDPKASLPVSIEVFAYDPAFTLLKATIDPKTSAEGTITESIDFEHSKPANVQTIEINR
jgi:hypothetical protein